MRKRNLNLTTQWHYQRSYMAVRFGF